jgi:hypothetical protein
MNIAKSPNHNKTLGSAEWHNADSFNEDQRKSNEKEASSTPKNNTDEMISLKPLLKKEF